MICAIATHTQPATTLQKNCSNGNPKIFILMSTRIISKSSQAYGAFNGGQIVENKPIGFPQDGGFVRPYSNLFYWARARAVMDSTIGLHPHQGFEIMSFILKGRIRHFDTQMNAWKELEAGGAQIIRAGNGIQHAEHMYKDSVMFQIWMDPDLDKTLKQEASYDDFTQEDIPVESAASGSVAHFAGGKGPMRLDSPGVLIQQWDIEKVKETVLEDARVLSAYVVAGNGRLNGETITRDDFIIMEDQATITIEPGEEGLNLFVIQTPQVPDYKTYMQRMQERMHTGA